MSRFAARGVWTFLLIAAVSCTQSHDVGPEVEGDGQRLSQACVEELREAAESSYDSLPEHLGCTGLYKDIEAADKKLANGVREFAPAVPFWSDGAIKSRFVFVPKGKKIDAANPEDWKFPVGTKLWKEFRVGSRRVETRIYQKADESTWEKIAYEWNDDETEATRTLKKELTIDGEPYTIPGQQDCNECHNGRVDRVLGFEQISLGLAGAGLISLSDLVADDLLENFNGPVDYEIGDDGTGLAAKAFSMLHINCGVSCHNGNPGSKGYSRGMRLVLDAAELDGRPSNDFKIATTTINQDAVTPRWLGQKRIVPGKPDESLLFKLLEQRGDPKQQMPPLLTRRPDPELVDAVRAWILALEPQPSSALGPD